MIKYKWFAVLLNLLVPGLGFLYAQRTRQAVLTYLLGLLVYFSLRGAVSFTLLVFWLCLALTFYLYLIVGAYRSIVKGKVYESTRTDKVYLCLLVIAVHIPLGILVVKPVAELMPIQFATIPTPAMSPTLRPGDRIAFQRSTDIARNDVTIFHVHEPSKSMYVFRCVGLPGDSLAVRNGHALSNGQNLDDHLLKFAHNVTVTASKINPRILAEYNLNKHDYIQADVDRYRFFLTDPEAEQLKRLTFVRQVTIEIAEEGQGDPHVFPGGPIAWNADYFGPLYVPKKGDVIALDAINVKLYYKCIATENDAVEETLSGLTIGGEIQHTYQFKKSYYFMMGDNRHNAFDSRYLGFVSEEDIIGKAMYLYWSTDHDRIGATIE